MTRKCIDQPVDPRRLPAFPIETPLEVYGGMNKLEFATIHILQGMLAAEPADLEYQPQLLAKRAVILAKAAFDELEK